jgi:hypothetical protein
MATDVAPDLDATLRLLAGQRSAVVPLAELPAVLGRGEAEAIDLAADLEADGWVEVWDDRGVILSPMGADRLGVELQPVDERDPSRCRWVVRGSARDRPPPRGKSVPALAESVVWPGVDGGEGGHGFDGLADVKAIDPARDATDSDPGRRVRLTGRPGPLRLLGTEQPWPLDSAPCGGCQGRPLKPRECCLWCLRSGFDAVLPSVPVAERPKVYHPSPSGLAGGKGRARGRPVKVSGARATRRRAT